MKKPYSVLLLYPDYANDSGAETYYAFVEAADPIAAVAVAQRQASGEDRHDPGDYAPLLVIEGHHYGQPLFNKGVERRKPSCNLWDSHQEPQELRRCDPTPRWSPF
jgi:hypothetical protein